MTDRKMMVAPSILAADFGHLAAEIASVEKVADFLHFDVMDGHFVPNISFGIPVLRSIRPYSELPFDIHLMIENPEQYVRAFAEAGADYITFHIETVRDPADLADKIRSFGCRPGISIHPDTPTDLLKETIRQFDLVLVMSVRPGFGGQGFMPAALGRIQEVRQLLDSVHSEAILSVDGGIGIENSGLIAKAGASLLVAGSTVFGARDHAYAVRELKRCAML